VSDAQAELATTDADAMADYAKALHTGESLEAVGKQVVNDLNPDFNAPWMALPSHASAAATGR